MTFKHVAIPVLTSYVMIMLVGEAVEKMKMEIKMNLIECQILLKCMLLMRLTILLRAQHYPAWQTLELVLFCLQREASTKQLSITDLFQKKWFAGEY